MGETIARWPRLLSEPAAAEYLSLSPTTLRTLGVKVRRVGRRVLYDIRDLDLYVDRMDDQPPKGDDRDVADEEARFFAARKRRRG